MRSEAVVIGTRGLECSSRAKPSEDVLNQWPDGEAEYEVSNLGGIRGVRTLAGVAPVLAAGNVLMEPKVLTDLTAFSNSVLERQVLACRIGDPCFGRIGVVKREKKCPVQQVRVALQTEDGKKDEHSDEVMIVKIRGRWKSQAQKASIIVEGSDVAATIRTTH
ncbi:hypothetical protein BR93DRAFT_927060 [Coniochaeta sp. PMI_546]|nr:hypothetical protein BR93DRAFT_927060 [Coniochaeta sp. PMI_546]